MVLKQGQTATEEEMIDFCRERLAPFKVPKRVDFREDLPKSAVGKLLRSCVGVCFVFYLLGLGKHPRGGKDGSFPD